MQTGHANALPWGDLSAVNPDRENTLSPLIKFLARRFAITNYTVNYARLFMAVKGFLIGLPVGGIITAIYWPLGYEIGNACNSHRMSEFVAGAGAGVSVSACLYLINICAG